jgi:hypothetical protein
MSWLDIGCPPFANKAVVINALPPNLFGAGWIVHANPKDTDLISLTVLLEIDIFIGYASGMSVPAFLQDFEDMKTRIITDEDGGKNYSVYRKRFQQGSTVSIPSDSDTIIMFLPASSMQPAFDLKPITTYRAGSSIVGDGVNKEPVSGREALLVTTDQKTEITWAIQTGVADRYSFTVKYRSAHETSGNIQLFDAGGNRMLDQPVNFTITKEGKWNQVTITTENMINAGRYQLKLVLQNAKDLAVSGIDLQ